MSSSPRRIAGAANAPGLLAERHAGIAKASALEAARLEPEGGRASLHEDPPSWDAAYGALPEHECERPACTSLLAACAE